MLIGAHLVVIIGGCNDTSNALSDCYMLNVEELSLKMVSRECLTNLDDVVGVSSSKF